MLQQRWFLFCVSVHHPIVHKRKDCQLPRTAGRSSKAPSPVSSVQMTLANISWLYKPLKIPKSDDVKRSAITPTAVAEITQGRRMKTELKTLLFFKPLQFYLLFSSTLRHNWSWALLLRHKFTASFTIVIPLCFFALRLCLTFAFYKPSRFRQMLWSPSTTNETKGSAIKGCCSIPLEMQALQTLCNIRASPGQRPSEVFTACCRGTKIRFIY